MPEGGSDACTQRVSHNVMKILLADVTCDARTGPLSNVFAGSKALAFAQTIQ